MGVGGLLVGPVGVKEGVGEGKEEGEVKEEGSEDT